MFPAGANKANSKRIKYMCQKDESLQTVKMLTCVCSRLGVFKEKMFNLAKEYENAIEENTRLCETEEEIEIETSYAKGGKNAMWDIIEEFTDLFDDMFFIEE